MQRIRRKSHIILTFDAPDTQKSLISKLRNLLAKPVTASIAFTPDFAIGSNGLYSVLFGFSINNLTMNSINLKSQIDAKKQYNVSYRLRIY